MIYRNSSQKNCIVITCIAAIGLRACLDFVYIKYVSKFFSSDFPFDTVSFPKLAMSYGLVFLFAAWLSFFFYKKDYPSGIFMFLQFSLIIMPLTSIYGLSNAPVVFIYYTMVSFAVLLFVYDIIPVIKIPRPTSELFFIGALIVFAIMLYVFGYLILIGGIGRISFDLRSVYELRYEYTNIRGPLIGRFVPWLGYVFNMIPLCFGLYKRNYILIGFAIILQLLFFGLTGFKSFLFAPFLVGGLYLIWGKRNYFLYVMIGATSLIIIVYGIFLVSGNHYPPSILIRRLFFVPAGNHLIYYDFFSQLENPFILMSNSNFVANLFQHTYPYELPLTRVVSYAYYGRDFSPNVGYLGEAYAQFGFLGMLFYSAILGFILKFMDSVARNTSVNIAAALYALPLMALINSALLTSFITHGIFISILVVWLMGILTPIYRKHVNTLWIKKSTKKVSRKNLNNVIF